MAAKRERHAQLPLRVLFSEAYRTLGYFERAVLVALCAEYTGHNNGSLALTNIQADEKYGIKGKRRFYSAISELENRHLIRCTYRGKLRQIDKKHSPSRYALSFRPQNENAVYGVKAESQPRDRFEHWTDKNKKPGPARGYDDRLHRTPPRIPEVPLPDPPADTESVPARGPPIRISPPRGVNPLDGSSKPEPVTRRASNG